MPQTGECIDFRNKYQHSHATGHCCCDPHTNASHDPFRCLCAKACQPLMHPVHVLHVFRRRARVNARNPRPRDDVRTRHLTIAVGLFDQPFARTAHGLQIQLGVTQRSLPATRLHSRTLVRLAFKKTTAGGQARPRVASPTISANGCWHWCSRCAAELQETFLA